MSPLFLRSVLKSVTRRSDVPRRYFSSSPFINGDRLVNWAVRVFSLGCGGVTCYCIKGDPGKGREDYWQAELDRYRKRQMEFNEPTSQSP